MNKKVSKDITDEKILIHIMDEGWYLGDEIIAAITELIELREKQRWIPMTEKLPENEYEKVLGYDGHHIFMTYKVGTFFDFDTVTHWMQLPSFPEQGE